MTTQVLFVSLPENSFLPLSSQVSAALFCCRQQPPDLSLNYAMFLAPVEEGRPSKEGSTVRLALCSLALFSLAGVEKKVTEMNKLM